MVQKVLLLALAGAVGTLTRFGLSGIVRRYNTTPFPWGTFAVNMTGCFLVGILWALFESRRPLSPESRTIVLVGFMGAFTRLCQRDPPERVRFPCPLPRGGFGKELVIKPSQEREEPSLTRA